MASPEISCLFSKKLVYNSPLPLPFCIYEGMGETVYLISNSVAFSSMYTPGVYRVLDAIMKFLAKKPLVVDDVLGMLQDSKFYTHRVWTREWISKLISLNRITWSCTHSEGPVSFEGHDLVAFLSPLAFLHAQRLELVCAESIDNNPEKWFLIPAGSPKKHRHVVKYYADRLKRSVYAVYVPTTAIDSCWVLIAPQGEAITEAPYSRYIHPVNAEVGHGKASIEKERALYESTYG